MTGPIGPRFAAPPRRSAIAQRFRAPGLGGQPELVPDETDETLFELESTTPSEGFTGIRSRSRFASSPKQAVIGHGYASAGDGAVPGPYDPGTGRTQFPDYEPDPGTFVPNERTSALDRLSEMLPPGFLRFFRRYADTTVPGFELQDPNAMGWGRNPPRSVHQLRFTLRPEFQQGAQSFSGFHTLIVKGARMSTSPARMGAPRTNRLTNRAAPGSYGQKTKVI